MTLAPLTLDMVLRALAGGALMGLSAALLVLLQGRVAGISGIFGRLMAADPGPARWRLGFAGGLIGTAVLAALAGWAPSAQVQGGLLLAVVAGLLTGVGTGVARGCTSGHGVCGLSNLSLRSLVATLCFMGSGAVTVYVMRHVIGGV